MAAEPSALKHSDQIMRDLRAGVMILQLYYTLSCCLVGRDWPHLIVKLQKGAVLIDSCLFFFIEFLVTCKKHIRDSLPDSLVCNNLNIDCCLSCSLSASERFHADEA